MSVIVGPFEERIYIKFISMSSTEIGPKLNLVKFTRRLEMEKINC